MPAHNLIKTDPKWEIRKQIYYQLHILLLQKVMMDGLIAFCNQRFRRAVGNLEHHFSYVSMTWFKTVVLPLPSNAEMNTTGIPVTCWQCQKSMLKLVRTAWYVDSRRQPRKLHIFSSLNHDQFWHLCQRHKHFKAWCVCVTIQFIEHLDLLLHDRPEV